MPESSSYDPRKQSEIIAELGVKPSIDVDAEIELRVGFLADYLRKARGRVLVLGISGGLDSTTAGRLCQLAAERLRGEGYEARFIAVRLPHGVQRDEADAQFALSFIAPDQVLDVNIKPAADGMLQALREAGLKFTDATQEDVTFGNIKARERMIAQYAIAFAGRGLVVGTDHGAEAVMGFFTKFGDGACDVAPLTGLNKRQVRQIARKLGAPEHLAQKVPTADLEELRPLLPDEESYGVSYEQIDDFLEGKQIDPQAAEKIVRQHALTAHKRALPAAPQLST
jgi:NAD+ synthase